MSTITLTLPADIVTRLAAEADGRGVPVAELLERLAIDFATRQAVVAPAAAFEQAKQDTFRENAELYRRLAQ